MNAVQAVRSGVKMVSNHPDLVKLYLRNKFRNTGLEIEQQTMNGFSKAPLGITFKPTLSCNLRCKMCSFVTNGAVFTNPKDSLPLETWKRVVDDVAHWKPYIWFTGGEPTLYPHFIPLIHYIKTKGMTAGVTTNGTTLKRRAEEMLENPMDMMVISIDGKGGIHNNVRGHEKAYERTTDGVLQLQELKKRKGIKNPVVAINCALTPDNYEYATDMVEVAKGLGADLLNFQHLWQFTDKMARAHNERWGHVHAVSYDDCGGSEPKPMDVENVLKVVRELKKMAKDLPFPMIIHPELPDDEIRLYYNEPETFVRRKPAACAWLNTDILPNGDVSPCFDVVCGNIVKENFRDIWNNHSFQAHRNRLNEDGDFPICARCCAYWRRD